MSVSPQPSTSQLTLPVWSNGFRPFFLLAAFYGPAVLAYWLYAYTGSPIGVLEPVYDFIIWHQHEMIFGFALAIVAGFLLTAVPSWLHIKPVQGKRLVLLVAAWLLGRLAMWYPWSVDWYWRLAADELLLALLLAMLGWDIIKRGSHYLVTLPIIVLLMLGNGLFHVGHALAEPLLLQQGTLVSLYSLILLYVVVGGFLTTIFTGNVLRQSGQGSGLHFKLWLEYACGLSIVLVALADIFSWDGIWETILLLLAIGCHGWRLLRWRFWLVWRYPLVAVMHLSYAWLVILLLIKLFLVLGWQGPSMIWVHAFTIGALGLKQLGLLHRVTLRHTGRSLRPHKLFLLSVVLMCAAALLRVSSPWISAGHWPILLAALMWCVPLLIYLLQYSKVLLSVSQAKGQGELALQDDKGWWRTELGEG